MPCSTTAPTISKSFVSFNFPLLYGSDWLRGTCMRTLGCSYRARRWRWGIHSEVTTLGYPGFIAGLAALLKQACRSMRVRWVRRSVVETGRYRRRDPVWSTRSHHQKTNNAGSNNWTIPFRKMLEQDNK
jgi:hypothetical protein